MSDKRTVQELPQLAGFPELPNIPEGKTLLVFSSPMRKAEKEFVLGFITTVAIRNQGWKPVSVHEFFGIMQEGALPLVNPQDVVNASWAMAQDGLLEIVHHAGEDIDYIIPSVELAKMLTESQLRYA